MTTKLVLLERVENLGQLGEIVSVRPGYARNYLLPQKKALRATKENIAYFEAQKKNLQADNEKRKKEAEKLAKKLEGLKAAVIRQASEAGQLFGSVTARDIATEVSKASGETVERQMVLLNQNFKVIGLFPVDIALHPEVKVQVTVNIARSTEEAQIQAKTGRALIAEVAGQKAPAAANEDTALDSMLEDGALEATKERKASTKAEADAEAAETAEKSKARAAKKKTKPKKAEEEASESEG